MKNVFYTLTLIIFMFPALVQAHEANSLPYGPFLSGITHPVLGLDHFLAMVSVGMVSLGTVASRKIFKMSKLL